MSKTRTIEFTDSIYLWRLVFYKDLPYKSKPLLNEDGRVEERLFLSQDIVAIENLLVKFGYEKIDDREYKRKRVKLYARLEAAVIHTNMDCWLPVRNKRPYYGESNANT